MVILAVPCWFMDPRDRAVCAFHNQHQLQQGSFLLQKIQGFAWINDSPFSRVY